MAKSIEPRYLERRILFHGPYIYFYDSGSLGPNKLMVEYINKMALEYPKLSVIKIDWSKYLYYQPKVTIEELYTVYLYYNTKKQVEVFMPNKPDIDEIFRKAVHFHNMKIENKVKNVGSRVLNINKLKDNKRRMRRLINQKILYKPYPKISEIPQIDFHDFLENDYISPKYQIENKIISRNINSLNNSPLFQNTNIKNLSFNILGTDIKKNEDQIINNLDSDSSIRKFVSDQFTTKFPQRIDFPNKF